MEIKLNKDQIYAIYKGLDLYYDKLGESLPFVSNCLIAHLQDIHDKLDPMLRQLGEDYVKLYDSYWLDEYDSEKAWFESID